MADYDTIVPLPSADHISWLVRLAHSTARNGQYLIAARFMEIAAALEDAERLNVMTFEQSALTGSERKNLQ